LTATWIADAPKPLLLSISKCTLHPTRCIPYHVRVPVLWTWSNRRTQRPWCQKPSPGWRRPVRPVTHTAINCQIKVSLDRTNYFLLTGHLFTHILSIIRWCLNWGLDHHNPLLNLKISKYIMIQPVHLTSLEVRHQVFVVPQSLL